mmetsp:Transcript_88479/g.250525  ORF Transcript_88479/g.250525 Transcript_88479/m.250525 type:complete len:394 (-) Transcript_88479:903-2084(-)
MTANSPHANLLQHRQGGVHDVLLVQESHRAAQGVVGGGRGHAAPPRRQQPLALQASHEAGVRVLAHLADVREDRSAEAGQQLGEPGRHRAEQRGVHDHHSSCTVVILQAALGAQRRRDAIAVGYDGEVGTITISSHLVKGHQLEWILRVRSQPRVVLVEEVPPVQQVRRVHAHHNPASRRLLDGVAEAPGVVGAVGVRHDVQPRRQVQAVMGVEIATEDSLVETLQPDHHAIWLFASGQPVHDHGLEKHVAAAVQVLRVRDLHNWQQARLGVANRHAQQGRLVRREVRHPPAVLVAKTFRHAVVASVLHVLPQVDELGALREQLVEHPGHAASHDRARPGAAARGGQLLAPRPGGHGLFLRHQRLAVERPASMLAGHLRLQGRGIKRLLDHGS